MKKKLLAGTVLSICLLSSGLSACSSEDKTEKPSSENQLQSDYMEVDGILTKTEKGSFSVHDGLMYFTDYETQTSIPVCGKPNCRHLSVYEDEKTTCNAVCSSSYMFPYKEKLYRIESVDNREGKLIASHMDGSNPKTVGTFSSGDMLESAVILNENMYYTYCELQNKILAEQEDGQAQSGQAMGSNCSLNRLNLDTLEQTEIVKLEDVSHILMLGGTKEYQVCAVVKDDGVQYNLFDYESGTLTEISLNTVDYQRVEVTQDGKGFYYIGDEGKSLYCYHIDSKENEKIVQAEEVGAEKVTVEGVSEEGILFRAFPENELYVKNEEGISNLKLSDRLPTDQAWLSGINDITKDGVYFTYQEKYIGEKEIEGDLLMYDAYIEKEDLFGKTGEMKVIYTPTAVEIVQKQEENKYAHEGFSEAYSQVMYIMSNNQGKGVNEQELVYEKGYQLLFGDKAVKERLIGILLCVIAAVYSASGVLGTEYDLKVMNLLRSTKRGRKELFLKKLGVSFGITAVIFVLVKIPAILKVVGEYPLECWGAKVRSMMFAGQSVINCSIFGYVLMLMIMQLVTLFVIVFSTMALSVVLKDSTMTMILSLLLFGGPLLIEWGGVPIVHYLSLNSLLDGHQILQGNWLVLISEIVIFWGALSFAAGYVLYRAYENRR